MEDKLSIDEPSIEIKILKSIPDYHFVCQSGNTVILLVLFKKKTEFAFLMTLVHHTASDPVHCMAAMRMVHGN